MPPETIRPMPEKQLEGRADIERAQIDGWIVEVRRNGYSAVDGMLISGLKTISAPVFNMQGELVAAMSLVGPQKALMEIPGPVTDLFLAATRRASQRLGFETANSKPK
jgi:DNA-binding IclR family transcriptional regulator